MADANERRNNGAAWWGLLLAILALGVNAAFLAGLPFQRTMRWLSLFLAVVAGIFLIMGLRRAIVDPKVYRHRVPTIIVSLIAMIPAGLSVFGFVAMGKLPSATAAPQIGQRVPDFMLADTSGKPVSLDQLLAAPSGAASGPPSFDSRAPKAVLLIFYRGYW